VPKPGMVRLWTWEAMAHGAEVVSYFRWRQAPFAQEQYHAGLNLPGLDELSPGGLEAGVVANEIAQLGPLPAVQQAPVAIVFDYASYWATMVQPQGRDFRYEELAFRWYEALRRRGLDVDVVRPGAALDGYAAVIVPTMIHVTAAAQAALQAAQGVVLIGPRSGSRDRNFAIPHDLPPGPLHALTQNRVIEAASLRPGLSHPVNGAVQGAAIRWRDHATSQAQVLARFADGGPALTQQGRALHLLCWPDQALLGSVMDLVCGNAGLQTMALPEHIRLRRRGDKWFFTNYGPDAWTLPEGFDCLLGGHHMPAHSVTVAVTTAPPKKCE
jgi:beta-galactosidase